MKLSSLIFLLIVFFTDSALAQEKDSLAGRNWYKLEKPDFHCSSLVIGLERFNNQNFNDFIWNLIRLNYFESFQSIRGRFVAEFTLNKNNKFNKIDIIEKVKADGLRDFNQNIILLMEQSLNHWTTAKINGIPIESRIRVEIVPATQIHSDFNGTFEWIITPELANQYYNEGVKMFEAKEYAEAIKFFDETLVLTTKDIDALYNRGVCKFKTNDKSGACEDWKRISSVGKPDADGLISKYCN